MADHRKRFERWRKKLPKNTAYFVDQVLTRIVPEFEARGFVWYPDYAGGDAMQIGANCIPLQRRSGNEWPTVQIHFDKRFRPFLGLDFAKLPPVCTRWTMDGEIIKINREIALVFEGAAYFALSKGRGRDYHCNFGYIWFSLFPRRRIDKEIGTLLALLPELFELFDQGIPEAWLRQNNGFVSKHVFAMGARDESGKRLIV